MNQGSHNFLISQALVAPFRTFEDVTSQHSACKSPTSFDMRTVESREPIRRVVQFSQHILRIRSSLIVEMKWRQGKAGRPCLKAYGEKLQQQQQE